MSIRSAYDRRVFLASLAGLASCSRPVPVKVGSKSGTEQTVLGEIVTQFLQKKAQWPVERLALEGTTEAHQALLGAVVDLYPEYPSAAVAEILKQEMPTDGGALLEICRAQYQSLQLEWLDPLGYESRFTLVMLASTTRADNITTMSDLTYRDRAWRLGVTRDFQRRQDGFPTLQKAYSLRLKDAPRVEPGTGQLFSALMSKTVDLIAVESSCGQLADPVFHALPDDRIAFGQNRPALVIRQDAETRFPGLRKILAGLSGKLDDKTIRSLNREVDVNKKPAAEVAGGFLRKLGV